MADISVKMGVTGLSTFKSGMNQAKESVKTLDAELKLNAERYKASGDAETYMANKTKILQQQIKEQEKVVKNAKDALAEMTRNGIDPASTAYQKMQQQLLNAETTLTGMQNNLKGVGTTAKTAATDANTLTTNLKQIGKQVNYDGVINGIGRITSGLEKAAKNVADFASSLWDTMRDAASWADDKQTLAQMYGLDVETLQRMEKTQDKIDTPVEAIIKSQQRLKNSLVYGTDDFQQALRTLHVGIKEGGNWIQNNYTSLKMRDATDIFWDIGDALVNYGDEIERDAMAQKIFGRSWMELMPLFTTGRKEYETTMDSWSVVSEENVQALGDLDDSLQTLENEFETLKLTVLSEIAPAIETVSEALTGIIKEVNAYLQTDEGKEKLKALGDSVAELFKDLTSMDTGEIVKKVGGALDSIKSVLDWVVKNKDGIVTAIEAIAGAWVAMKLAQTAATIGKAWNGLRGLLGSGGAAAAGGGGAIDGVSTAAAAGGAARGGSWLSKLFGKGASAGAAAGGAPAVPTTPTTPTVPTTPASPKLPFKKAPTKLPNGALLDMGGGLLVEAGVIAAAITPAILVQNNVDEKLVKAAEAAEAVAEEASGRVGETEEVALLRRLVNATNAERDENGEYKRNIFGQYVWMPGDDRGAILAGLGDWKNRGILHADIERYGARDGMGGLNVPGTGWTPWALLQRYWGNYYITDYDTRGNEYQRHVDMPLDPQEETALLEYLRDMYTRKLQDQMRNIGSSEEGDDLGTATAQAVDDITKAAEQTASAFDNLTAKINAIEINLPQLANGISSVPFDGYIAALHKGERVVPANQNRNYNVYNNTYFDRTTVSGGVDADGLAARIATAQRRALSAVGS